MKKKQLTWIKWPLQPMADDRVAELISDMGMKGLGIYVCILQEMYKRNSLCMTLKQLKAMKLNGASKLTICDVVKNYGLFTIDDLDHIKSNIAYFDANDDDEEFSKCIPNELQMHSDALPTPARVSKETEKDKDIHLDVDGEVVRQEDYISRIPQDSEWTELALMKSGFGELIHRNWAATMQLFRQHAIVNCTMERIANLEAAKKYFYYFITNTVSGARLRADLEEYETLYRQDQLYIYEDPTSRPGHRSYHGIALPDNAPPRPNDRADWDLENLCWV